MMVDQLIERRVFQLFADLLDYPRASLVEAVRECAAHIALRRPEAAALLRDFEAFVSETSLGRLQEVYSGVFDLDAACHPYVGYHLFGESYKRSIFLLELRKRFREQGFVVENELPDHLAVLLRFLSVTDDVILASEIVHEALLPALDRMTGKAKSAGYDEQDSAVPQDHQKENHPYYELLEAVRLALQQFPVKGQGHRANGNQRVANEEAFIAGQVAFGG